MNIDACKRMWVAAIHLDANRELAHENPDYVSLCEFWLASFAQASQEWQESLGGYSESSVLVQAVSERCRLEAIEQMAAAMTGMAAI